MNRISSIPFRRIARRAVDPARSTGSVMLLVVGVLLLVLIVGMTYMHVVQEDRRAGLTVDIDAIVLAQADLIGVKLFEDLAISSTGQHFADNDSDGSPDQEPFDYPGPLDKWLAATAPEDAGPNFRQITLLGDAFWNGTDSTTDTTQTLTATDAGTAKNSNLPADADGDGIIDSKPELAAVYSRGGLVFYSWCRVQDSSSLANVNVWGGLYSGSAYDSGANAPRWWYPGELDLGYYFYTFTSSGSFPTTTYDSAMSDLSALLTQRGVTATLPTPWGISATGQRGHAYFFGSKRYEEPLSPYKSLHLDTSGAFDPSNEMELRHRNGLVYLESEADIEATGWGRNIFRGGVATAEPKWGPGTIPGVSTIATFFTNEPRHQMTTYSGASIYRMPLGSDAAPAPPFYGKRDINAIMAAANPEATLAQEIARVYGSAPATVIPSTYASAAEFADQLAVNIIDYADADNQLTLYNGRVGMEALPAITEVYMQHPYIVNDPPTAGSANNWTVNFATAGDTGYAIEIRNPFPKEISLENVHLYVSGASWGELSTLAGKTTLAANDYIVLYRNSSGAAANDDVGALITGDATKKAAITNTWPVGAFATIVTVSLRAEDQDGNILTWDYCDAQMREAQGAVNNAPCDHPGPTAADVVGHTSHLRVDYMGNGNRLNSLLIDKANFTYTVKGQRWSNYNQDVSEALGDADKTGSGGPANKINPTASQLVFSDSGIISHIGELLHIAVFSPTSTQNVATAWGSATSAGQFMLKPGTTDVVAATTDYSIPHALLLVDRLTTLSPREDLVDNDGDGSVDEEDELFIPGTLNLNTAPEYLLDRVLPIGSAAIRQAYVDAIIAYRDTPGTTNRTTADYRSGRKGLAYVSEVYNLSSLATSNDYGRNTASDYNGASFGNIQGDFLSNPASADDGIIDDAEEKSLVTRWLTQTCSTRSDVFVAYILVRGYTPGNLNVPVTERRAAVLMDRSRVATEDDGVRVLGIIWY